MLLAAAAHGSLAPSHFAEWWGYGLFFLAAGLLQAVWGLALLTKAVNPKDSGPAWHRRTAWLYGLGLAGNVAAILLYLVTRTVGIPGLGPEGYTLEAEVGALDVATKVAEAVSAGLLGWLLRLHLRGPA